MVYVYFLKYKTINYSKVCVLIVNFARPRQRVLTTTPTTHQWFRTAKRTLVGGCALCFAFGKMAALLLKEFNDSEISNLPPTFQNKLEEILTGLQYKIDSLKSQQEQFRVDSGKINIVIICVPRVYQILLLAGKLRYSLLIWFYIYNLICMTSPISYVLKCVLNTAW